MASGWIVKRGEKEQGPFSAQQLKQFAEAGKIRKTDLVRKQGTEKFVPALKIKGLFTAAKSPARKPQSQPKVYEQVEIIEEEGSPDDFDADYDAGSYSSVDEDYDDYGTVAEDYGDGFDDYEDYEDYDDYEEAPRSRRGSSRQGSRRESSRRQRSSRGPSGPPPKPSKKKPASKKKSAATSKPRKRRASEDEDEDGPWGTLIAGIVCLGFAVGCAVYMGSESPNLTGRGKGALIALVVNFIYSIGGKWLLVVLLALGGMVCIGMAIQKFQED